jgi:hypothetical protein
MLLCGNNTETSYCSFTHSPTVHMYFYTMQQNKSLTTLNKVIYYNYADKLRFWFLFATTTTTTTTTDYYCCEPGSSVTIVSGYDLDDRAITFDPRQRPKNFSSILCVQTGSGANPASCTMGTGGPFPGAKVRPGRDADHSHPSSDEVENE